VAATMMSNLAVLVTFGVVSPSLMGTVLYCIVADTNIVYCSILLITILVCYIRKDFNLHLVVFTNLIFA
jgi:hypothetical protein